MCHHWGDDEDADWEQLMEDLPEDDPESQEPKPERKVIDPPRLDD